MDGFNLRCNNLRCRRILDIRAVVTTCSHVFCEHCAENLHLTNPPPGRSRQCPACQASLTAPDDAVITNLSPSEDYRTSLLSGLAPSVIMEICQRGLAFWNYQVTQEVVYQETIAKGLTDKCIALSNDLDKVINDANMEIARLQEKVATLKISEDDLKKKNHELMENWREKGRKLAQTQELYDKLKRRTLMTQVGQGAVENLERAFGPQQPIHDLSGEDLVGFNASRNHQPSTRRHKNIDPRPDFMMKGAQVGNINGSRRARERTGSSSSTSSSNAPPRFTQPPTPNIYAQQHGYPGDPMAIPPSSQEHRQRLPPTPSVVASTPAFSQARTTLFGQNSMNMGATINRNPLGGIDKRYRRSGHGQEFSQLVRGYEYQKRNVEADL